jgi:hypothetical protein
MVDAWVLAHANNGCLRVNRQTYLGFVHADSPVPTPAVFCRTSPHKGAHYRLLFAVALIGLVSVAAGTLAMKVDGGSRHWSDAVWWAFLRLTDPGYLRDDVGVIRRLISLSVNDHGLGDLCRFTGRQHNPVADADPAQSGAWFYARCAP